MNVIKRGFALILLLGIIAGLLAGCTSKETPVLEKPEDFKNATIGILTGSSLELLAKQQYPDAKRVYFSRPADMVLAVEQGKVDGYLLSTPFIPATVWENANVKRIDEALSVGDIAYAFPKDSSSDPLREQLNSFISQAREDGTLQRLEDKWQGDTEPTEHPDYMSLEGKNGTIRLAAVAENKPIIYQYRNQCTGYEMDLLTLFAQQYGYRFEVEVVPFDSVIMGMATGRYDMCSACLQITPERAESVNFSDPHMQFEVVFMVKGDGSIPHTPTLADIENSTIGLVTGTNWDNVAKEKFPNAERLYFNNSADVVMALEQGKIDTFFADKTVFAGMRWRSDAIACIDEPIEKISNALILAKEGYDPELLSQINTFVAKTKADGTLAALDAKWFGNSEPAEHPDYTKLTGENGTLRIAIGDSMIPSAYAGGVMYTGYEVDFLTMFAEEYGYKLHMEGMAFEALIPSVSTGRCDIGACGITVTDERAESVTFADSHFETYGVAVVRSDFGGIQNSTNVINSLDELEEGRFGILTGSIWDGVLAEYLPDAEPMFFSTMADMFLAIEQGKVDAILGDRTFYINACWENVPVGVLDETVGYISCGFMLPKENYNETLLRQLNEFIARGKEDGSFDVMFEKWHSDTEPAVHPDYLSLDGEEGVIRVAVDDTSKPITYRKGSCYTGFDVELLTEFAREYGYRLEIEGMTFDGLIPAVSGGRFDIAACGTAITAEREESVIFTDTYMRQDGVVIVRNQSGDATEDGFFDKISESFEKTFIREDRWTLILEGMWVTMIISISAAAAGTVLGLGLYMLSRSDVRLIRVLANGISKVYTRIIAGTPVVVILMILFYVVFGSVRDISGVVVAIIGFTLIFGAFVLGHMAVSVSSVDVGQTEAAYSLGYTKNKTFFRIVLPQAMKIFLPSYCSQAVELIKATAVVGYIAVNDLTKMGDIIRSNTYEAFFPLIATAVIYFLLTWIVSLLLRLLKRHFEPKHRSKEKILKGVRTV